MTISLYNTLSKQLDKLNPVAGNVVSIYSCGPTVYDYIHIGNLRAFLFADVLQRTIRAVGGYTVRWVMNITDIDDKTIRDSSIGSSKWMTEMGEQNSDPNQNLRAFTQYYGQKFLHDIAQVGIRSEDFHTIPLATDFIPQMQELIAKIVANGYGYVNEGSVYFNLREWVKKEQYGKLFHVDFDNFKEGVRIDADEYERESVSDFVLWKARKEGEPFWDFVLNGEQLPGRPGWHIECSAMAKDLLGLPFDIHTGGVDLRFPHHEDEIAQSSAGYGVEPCAFWCHNEFLEVEGRKMSKSLGNFYTLNDLVAKGIEPVDIRFLMISAHYASVLNFTMAGIESARKARLRIQDFIYDVWNADGTEQVDVPAIKTKVFGHLAEDIHTPKALAELFGFINTVNPRTLSAETRTEMLEFFSSFNEVFSVWQIGERPIEVIVIPDEVMQLAELRWQAKQSKQFAESDRLREEIDTLGYIVKDKKDGFDVLPKE
jgi:cysteinyl-tRNA synthetase